MLALSRIPFILFNSYIVQAASRPPNDEHQKRSPGDKTGDLLTEIVWWFIPVYSVLLYSMSALEIYVIVLGVYPAIESPLRPFLLPSTTGTIDHVRITPSFLIGSALIVAGSLVRFSCYRHMGRHFIFKLGLCKEHKLVTKGPYSVVRHPAYSGTFILSAGLIICQMGSGSWWAEYGMWRTILGVVLGFPWVVALVTLCGLMIVRTEKEEAMLRDEFKDQWIQWENHTRYKLVPGVY